MLLSKILVFDFGIFRLQVIDLKLLVCSYSFSSLLGSGNRRTSFHPLFVKEAKHIMEVWEKYGDDNVSIFCFPKTSLFFNLFNYMYFFNTKIYEVEG